MCAGIPEPECWLQVLALPPGAGVQPPRLGSQPLTVGATPSPHCVRVRQTGALPAMIPRPLYRPPSPHLQWALAGHLEMCSVDSAVGQAPGSVVETMQRFCCRQGWAQAPVLPPTGCLSFSHSVVSDSLQPQGLQHARPPCPSPTPGVYSTHVHCVGDAIQPSHPLWSLLLLPSVFPSIRVFSHESVLHIRWPKYWNFSFRINPSSEYSGLVSFRVDWFDLAVQGALRSLPQHRVGGG